MPEYDRYDRLRGAMEWLVFIALLPLLIALQVADAWREWRRRSC